ncbi:MAG: Ig-like domain-containing protein [Candidatus Eisenbacteria bacterium]|uniref:Ig-like domain-containing protein n=1 Tax=Eiseniibacteriota bacterium TaxID=2212470 RepID=A0A948RWH6_UNCEI|nr:Ig-like domain-containing protein [Candidatus Eisenbacteria bacterium]MBU1947594.1 Ig-like domain-containing protein [Candidatus Eisenbacteria bacterium]MBU2690297.1 Ig-like domain-containing protein [Candidatus Eisenbacteria bacterium]
MVGFLSGIILQWIGGGCAQIEPPSGGPEDKTPPTVLLTVPESLAVGVGVEDPFVISFSESMNKGTVEDWLFLSPEVDRLQFTWNAWDVTIQPKAPLQPNTTYVLLLGSEIRDRRRNPLASPVAIPFSTGDHLDMGRIEGQVIAGLLPAQGQFVFAWTGAPLGPAPAQADGQASEPVTEPVRQLFPPGGISDAIRRGQTDARGGFVLPHLPVNTPLTIAVLYDAGGNRSFDEKSDFWACFPDSLFLPDTLATRMGLEIYLVYPNEPGSINGTIVDSFCTRRSRPGPIRLRADSLRALLAPPPDSTSEEAADPDDRGAWKEWMQWSEDTLEVLPGRLYPPAIDSMLAGLALDLETSLEDSAYCARPIWVELFPSPDSSAISSVRTSDTFELKGIAPGSYWLRAYRDLNLSGDLTEGEPESAWMGPYEIQPVRSIDSLQVSLPVLPKPWPENLLPLRGGTSDSTRAAGKASGEPGEGP